MLNELTITLPHSPRALSPNGRAHWAVKAAETRRARTMAWAAVMKALNGQHMVPTHYTLRWFYKGAVPDADNCLARCKAYLDGACAAFGVDDRSLDCSGIERIHDKQKAGTIELIFIK